MPEARLRFPRAAPFGACADPRTRRWWTILFTTSLLNVALWCLVAWSVQSASDTHVRPQLALSAIFVAACAFRSSFPRVDLERRCLWNSPWSSIFLGRSVATVAEMCFAGQCALLVLKHAEITGNPVLAWIGLLIVPIIALAQVFCWYAVVSLNHLGHALEEILWSIMVLLLAWSLALAWDHTSAAARTLMLLGLVACLGAAVLMMVVDVPMYVRRWREGRRAGRRYLPVAEGCRDALRRRQVAHGWHEWRPEVPWMSLYFSVGVWLSLGLVFV